ncbi:MAG: HisA/HisF-related TIM barrel protein, partial [Candidatus Jordarchaeales archaeon]
LKGADTETISRLVRYVGVNIVASGGIRSISDIVRLRKVGAKGVVIGKALYMGLFSLREAKEAAGEC